MAVRNIARGYIGGTTPPPTTIDTSSYFNTTLTFSGAFSGTYNVTFNKIGRIIVLSLPPIMEIPAITTTPTAALPAGYEGIIQQNSMLYVISYDSAGTDSHEYVGVVHVTNAIFSIVTSGIWNPASSSLQGIPTSTTFVYISQS